MASEGSETSPPRSVRPGKRSRAAAPKGPLKDIPGSDDEQNGSDSSLLTSIASSAKSVVQVIVDKSQEAAQGVSRALKWKSRRKRPRKDAFDDLAYNPLLDPDLAPEDAIDATPSGYLHRFRRLPKSVYERVAEVQPNDARCPVTLLSNSMRLLQLAHLAANSIDEVTAQRLAYVLGLELDCFNPGTSSNLLYLYMETHLALDAGFCVFVPSEEVLQVMDYALDHYGLPPPGMDFAEESGINAHYRLDRRNTMGFLNCDEVFKKNYARPCDFLPLKNWPSEHCIWRLGSPIDTARTSGRDHAAAGENTGRPSGLSVYRWPFISDGRPTLPKVLLHNKPYLIVWNGYVTLKKLEESCDKSLEGTAQELFQDTHIELIMRIGRKIEQQKLPSSFFRSPSPPNLGYDGLEEDVEWAEGDLELLEGMQDRNLALESSVAADSDEDQEHWEAEGRHTEGL
ncbi:hypothetical protein EV122DRAFT_224420 [Schizophyllum commune]